MRLEVWVQPKSRRPGQVKPHHGGLRVSVKAPPEKGEANLELLATLAGLLGVRGGDLKVVGGATSRRKWVEIPESASKAVATILSGSRADGSM